MIPKHQDGSQGGYAFYGAQYARFGSPLSSEVRREAYGEDLGQQGWRSLDEQAEIVALVGRRSPCNLLDVACGSAGPSLAIASLTGCRLIGVDIEPAAIAEAGERADALGLGDSVTFVAADCSHKLPFDASAFDVVVCVDAVLHLEDRRAALADWFRLLKPGGSLFLTDAAVLTGALSKKEIDVRASQGHFVFVPPGLNETAIGEAGLRLAKTRNTTPRMAEIAQRLYAARDARSEELRKEEGGEWFGKRQAFLASVETLAASGRLSRFLYVAEKPM